MAGTIDRAIEPRHCWEVLEVLVVTGKERRAVLELAVCGASAHDQDRPISLAILQPYWLHVSRTVSAVRVTRATGGTNAGYRGRRTKNVGRRRRGGVVSGAVMGYGSVWWRLGVQLIVGTGVSVIYVI